MGRLCRHLGFVIALAPTGGDLKVLNEVKNPAMGLGRKLYERHLQDSSLTLRVTKETNQKAAGKPVAFLNTLKTQAILHQKVAE